MKTVHLEEEHPVHLLETLLAMTVGSIGSKQYRCLYIDHPSGPIDVIGDGDLACAFFISSVLTLCNLIDCVHTTVDEVIKDLIESGWVTTTKPKAGAVVIWAAKLSGSDNLMHRHIGLCINKFQAVSTNPQAKSPQLHGIWSLVDQSGKKREVVEYYIHPDLK